MRRLKLGEYVAGGRRERIETMVREFCVLLDDYWSETFTTVTAVTRAGGIDNSGPKSDAAA